jgi:hypothetical protein
MAKNQNDGEMLPGPQEDMQTAYGSAPRRKGGYQRQGMGEAVAKSFIRSIASALGRILVRVITGRLR